MKKKLFAVAMMVLVLAVIGCSKKKATDGKTTLTFWTFQELHKGFMDDAVATWNAAHPDQQIELKTEVYPYDEMHNKLLIALQSGTGAPDYADIEISKFANYLKGSKPSLVPINKVVEPELKNLIKGRLDNYAKDGNYYGVDYHVGASVIYYNTELLGKAGVKVEDIVTWDDFVAAGKKVKAATGKAMTTLEVTEHWSYYPLICQQDSDFFAPNGDVILDNAVNTKTLQFLYDMLYKSKIAVAAPGGFHHAEEYWAQMNKGEFASIWMPMWYMGRFTDYMPDLKGKIAIRPLPVWTKGGKRSAGMGGTGTVITNQCENQDIAMELLAAAKLSKEGAIKTWTILGFDPIRWDAWEDPKMAEPNKFTEYFGDGVFAMLKEIKDEINPIVITEKFPAAVSLVQKSVIFKSLQEKSQTPAEALKAGAEELRNK